MAYVECLAKHYNAAYGTSKEVSGQKKNYHAEFILNNSIFQQTGLTHFLSGMWPPVAWEAYYEFINIE